MNKSNIEFSSKCQSNIDRKMSLKSRILKFLFDFNNDNNNKNMGESIECIKSDNNKSIKSIDCIENKTKTNNNNNNNNKNNKNNKNNNIEADINQDENDEFISYKNIKCIFDEIDRKYGGTFSQQQQEQNTNINNLRNCEMESPIPETSNYCMDDGEYDNDSLPIWEYNQHTSSLSFCIRVEANSDLKGESNFVLINISDLFCINHTNKEEQQRYYDGEFEIL